MKPEINDGRDGAPGVTRTRRGFLKDLTMGSVATAVAASALAATAIVPAAEAKPKPAPHPHPGKNKVFRFQPRNRVSCRACQKHHRYKIFRTRKIARGNRAHPGCDCPIVPQWILHKTYREFFKPAGTKRDVVDLRHIAVEGRR